MTLVILEVSRKQNYIFSSRPLKDNVRRSQEIAYVTGNGGRAFFRQAAGEIFREEQLISTGGGHTVLRFPDGEQARRFVSLVTEAASRRFRGMELYAKVRDYDETRGLGANLGELVRALEIKKSRRQASFGWRSTGVETLDGERWTPRVPERYEPDIEEEIRALEDRLSVSGRAYPREFQRILNAVPGGGENFLAVVHVDGNAMGNRSHTLYDRFEGQDFETSRAQLRRFSDGIQEDFETAFLMTAEELAARCPEGEDLPIRPVILAGDDVTFVTAGRYGLECARAFLESLAELRNAEDGKPYPACAGVAMVHKNYPFRRAYDLAEELCGEAKRFGVKIDPESRVSVMDWHIEFGQLKDSLSELRRDYETEDGNRLELRPAVVTATEGVDPGKLESLTGGIRTWRFFRGMCEAIRGETARGKIKNLREALKQGEVESGFYLLDREISDVLYHGLTAQYGDEAYRKAMDQILDGERKLVKDVFRQIGGETAGNDKKAVKRCLFFDAIEIADHCEFFGEARA